MAARRFRLHQDFGVWRTAPRWRGVQAECVRLEADLRQQRSTHHDALESIRADTRALLAEHEMVSAQLAECQRAAAEDGETRARVEAEREGIVRDLMALVQQQRGKLKRAQVRCTDGEGGLVWRVRGLLCMLRVGRRYMCAWDMLMITESCIVAGLLCARFDTVLRRPCTVGRGDPRLVRRRRLMNGYFS